VARVEAGAQRAQALVDAANGLQSRYGKERADIASLVAALLHRAGDRERAWERQHRAIERSAWAADDRAATMHLAVARSWVRSEPEREARVELAEARVHYFGLRYDRALEALARARAKADPMLAMMCDAMEADVLYYQDRFLASQRIAERCVAAIGEDPELADVRAQASQRLAELAVIRGDLGAALVWRQHTQACAEVTGRAWRVRIARLNVAEILAVAGRHDEAQATCEAVLADARADRDEDAVTAVRESLACIDVLAGRVERGRAFLERRAAELEASKDAWRLSAISAFTALIAAELDGEGDVEREVQRLASAFRAVPHDEAFTFAAMRRLAARLLERGRFELAREVDALLDARAERYRVGFSSSL
jgi:tetratricopeptide (TPR) repeat protein